MNFWYCYVLGPWEVFVFRSCSCKCCSPVALQKPQKGHSLTEVQLMSWAMTLETVQVLFLSWGNRAKQIAEQLLVNERLRWGGKANTIMSAWDAQLLVQSRPSDKQTLEELLSPENRFWVSLLAHSVTNPQLLVRQRLKTQCYFAYVTSVSLLILPCQSSALWMKNTGRKCFQCLLLARFHYWYHNIVNLYFNGLIVK